MFEGDPADFKKRLSWPQFVLQGLPDFLHVLTPDRRILYASSSCKDVTGFERNQLEGRFVSAFIHPDDCTPFNDALDESISSGRPVRFIYRFRKADWEWVILELSGHPHVSNKPSSTATIEREPIHQGFFVSARPYSSDNGTLLDSFLEHKLENERMLAIKADLRHAEQADRTQAKIKMESVSPVMDPSNLAVAKTFTASMSPPTQLPPPQRFNNCNDSPVSPNQSSQMTGKRFSNHINDQSSYMKHGNGNRSFIGDAGIPVSIHSNDEAALARTRGKRKRQPKVKSPMCEHCSTLVSPEWRKGPEGPKTLCNACGLRWSKEKRKSFPETRTELLP